MASSKTWPEFEEIVAKLQRVFYPAASVERNVRLPGKNSKALREIDIAIRQKIGINDALIIVECKHWARKIDVKAVEGFSSVREDVGADIAMMISSKGFSQGAADYATAKQINLFTHRDTKKETWPNGLVAPMILETWILKPIALYMKNEEGEQINLESDLLLDLHHPMGANRSVANLCRTFWDEHEPKNEGDYFWEMPVSQTLDGKKNQLLGIGIRTLFRRTLRVGKLHFEGLVNEQKCVAYTPAFRIEVDDEPKGLADCKLAFQRYPGLGILMQTTFVETKDEKTQALQHAVFSGKLFLDVKSKLTIEIPVKEQNSNEL